MAEGGVPDIESQKQFITTQLLKPLVKDDLWYILDVKWFKQWKVYVGYDSWDTYHVGEESANPGPIDNTPILQEGSGKLKEHLVDDLDFTLLPEEAWNKLVCWYSLMDGQEPLARKVIEEGVYSKSLKVEVYPWHLKICENSKPDEQISKQFSRSDTVEQLEKAMRKEFNISDDKEVRLWNRYMTNMYEPLNKKDNTLQDAGLYQGQVIVIEQINEDGTWPRQTAQTKTYNSSSSTRDNSTFITRSGNAYGGGSSSSYSSYSYEPGQGSVTPGLCGLSNIGNTCFMNSALQCMSNVRRLTDYFLSDRWENEINEDNPLGMHGEIARSYAELVQIIWSGKYSYSVPRNFKYAVGRFAPQFSGYQQQDAQELMAFLLDGLHEDLNRIKKKPYIEVKDSDDTPDEEAAREAWDNYKRRNDSIITDIFHGLLKSTVECPQCQKISVTFDPFCYLSLPLPVKKERQLDIFWLPLDPQKKPVQFKLTVPKMGIVTDLCEALSKFVNVPKEYMVVTDVYNHRFHKVFLMHDGISQIMERDDIFIYEVPVTSHEDPNTVILPIYMREESDKSNYNQTYVRSFQLFGQPLLLPVPRNNCTYDQLYNLILQRVGRFVSLPEDSDDWWVKPPCANDPEVASDDSDNTSNNHQESTNCNGMADDGDNQVSDGDNQVSGAKMEISNGESTNSSETSPDDDSSPVDKFPQVNGEEKTEVNTTETQHPPRMFKFTVVNSYGTAEMENKLKDNGQPLKLNSQMYVSVDWNTDAKSKFYNENSAESFEVHETMNANSKLKKQVIQLSDCLELFTTTEKLGENDPWYCPRCKKHQQATKKFDLWSLPDTLIIHLKRFSYNRYWRDKIDALVEFPIQGINMGKYVIDPQKDKDVYDLIGVVNHYGGLGGGHYTAYCQNPRDKSWYYFDDSNVSESNDTSSVTKAAYVLVYQRRGSAMAHGARYAATATSINNINLKSDATKDEEMDTN